MLSVLEAYRLRRLGLGHAGAQRLDPQRRRAVVLRRVEIILDRDLDLVAFHQRAGQRAPVHGNPALVVIHLLQIFAVAGVGVEHRNRPRIDEPRMFGPLPFRGREEHEHAAGDVRRLADRNAERHLPFALHRRMGTPIVRVEAAPASVGLLAVQVAAERRLLGDAPIRHLDLRLRADEEHVRAGDRVPLAEIHGLRFGDWRSSGGGSIRDHHRQPCRDGSSVNRFAPGIHGDAPCLTLWT